MSENVKIKINEYDKTSPASRSTDSTDVAFVPGFSSNPSAPKNTPILCRTVREFEESFGTTPLVFSVTDSDYLEKYGFKTVEIDRSYVYAKELLQQGMPVVYTNLFEDVYTETITSDMQPQASCTYNTDTSYVTPSYSKGVLTFEILKSITPTPAAFTVIQTTHNLPSNTSIFFAIKPADFVKAEGNSEGSDIYLDSSESFTYSTDTKGVEAVAKGGGITVINKQNTAVSVTIRTTIPFHIKANAEDSFSVTLKCPSSSLLDLFYDSTSNKINEQLELISDKSVYSVKYITTGGYPSAVKKADDTLDISLATEMLNCAEKRGEAVALIDYQKDELVKVFDLEDSTSYYHMMSDAFDSCSNGSFGAAMYPWGIYRCTASDISTLEMPASFGYLMCVAKAIKTSPNWLAMAGVTRGIVPNLSTLLTPRNVLSNNDAEELQPKYGKASSEKSCSQRISINCITDVKPYGLTLWGNRTLKPLDPEKGTTALNFLNTRNMLSDIKKVVYTTAKSLMFEQNSDTLWLRFKNSISPLLNQLKSGNGISDYKIIKGTTRYDGSALTRGEMSATIKIYPLYAVEYFELNIEVSDEDVTVS